MRSSVTTEALFAYATSFSVAGALRGSAPELYCLSSRDVHSMEPDKECSPYEHLRNQTVERNRNMMRILGLLPQRSESAQDLHATVKRRSSRNCNAWEKQPRRSERIAASVKSPAIKDGGLRSRNSEISARRSVFEGQSTTLKPILRVSELSREVEVHETELKMGKSDMQDGYSTDVSVDSLYAVEFSIGGDSVESVPGHILEKEVEKREEVTPSEAVTAESMQAEVAAAFGNQLQDFILRALMQSAGALSRLPTAVQTNAEGLSTGKESMSMGGEDVPKTWSERTYNIVKARRGRETQMTRTSAGEGSDSQKDLPVLENESPQQRAVRTQRLNRLRAKRAKDLTNNRKAFKKRPYVLHVDGMAKARGIHKQVWRAALRGQCGRLDPTMDNINHHPKHVVDSLWQALEKEWEFEGFSHRAREMFERSATKFMRNRKMQLKNKCKRIVDDSKPDDINGTHWKKIVSATQKVGDRLKPLELEGSTSKMKHKVRGPDQVHEVSEEDNKERNEGLHYRSLDSTSSQGRIVLAETMDVDARIQSLQTELLRLKNSRELGFPVFGSRASVGTDSGSGQETTNDGDTVSKSMKENVQPEKMNFHSPERRATVNKVGNEKVSQDLVCTKEKKKEVEQVAEGNERIRGSQMKESSVNVKDAEMDCGDVVRVYAYTSGIKEEIGKGIVMGLAGSKFAKKVIPEAWRSIKITSYTHSGASKICPFPPGWTEQLKSKTVKEVNGRMILWPDMLLRSVGDV